MATVQEKREIFWKTSPAESLKITRSEPLQDLESRASGGIFPL